MAIRSYGHGLRYSAFPVRPKPLDAVALLAPILGISLDLTCELIVGVAIACRAEIARGIALLIVEWRIIDISGQK